MVENIKCEQCGARNLKNIDEKTLKCEYCGSIIKIKEEQKQPKNLTEAVQEIKTNLTQDKAGFSLLKLIVCIFLGYFGVHRFIEGKIITGIIFLFTGGLFGIGYVFDIICLLGEFLKVRRPQ